jgi:hypothetical protein
LITLKLLGFYAVFDLGKVIAIVEGAAEARRLSPHRAYKRFASRLAAEEFAAWWNYKDLSSRT